ncbi:MAG: CHAT domain-containing protein, partial [Desulfomonilaceae bacterium]
AVQFTEELRSSLERDQRKNFFDVKVNGFFRTDPYKGLARALLKTDQASEAFKMAEFTKARVFSEAISNRSGEQNSNVPAAIIKSDQEINSQVSALKTTRQRAYEKEDKVLLASLEPQIKNFDMKLKSHIEMLREKYPVFAATKYPEPMDLGQQTLQENEWVITYDVSESGVLVFLLKGKQLVKSIFKPIPRNEIVVLVEKLRRPLEMESGKTLTEKLESFDFKSAKNLSDLLLGDLLTDLPKGVLVKIVPDDCLGLLPFESLVLNDGGKVTIDGSRTQVSGADFFGDRNQISYCQSVTALTLARAASANRKTGDQMLVIADPVFAITDDRAQAATQTKVTEGAKEHYENLMTTIEDCAKGTFSFNRLPETTALADNLSKLYGSKAEKMTGLDASKSNFINTKAKEIEKYRWIVFATHGLFSKNIPGLTEPFLALTMIPAGTDGFLTMSDVMSLKMAADLVALTACQSGIGKELYGEGTMSMGRAFQYAGARSVLMSLWSVAEKSSVMLVESFFKNLNDHKTKSEALKLARDDVRKAGYDHPFFWAPFILVGEVN